MQILFYDPMTPSAYDAATPLTRALGGTEATVIRVAEALQQYHRVYVAQHCRSDSASPQNQGALLHHSRASEGSVAIQNMAKKTIIDPPLDCRAAQNAPRNDDSVQKTIDATTPNQSVHYLSFEQARHLNPDVVILLRQYRSLEAVAQLFPKARRYLWLHNMPSRELYSARTALIQHRYRIIAVSQFHRAAIANRLEGKWLQRFLTLRRAPQRRSIPIEVLYNPIADTLQPDETPIQAKHLLFMSSPQKGLEETLKLFTAVLRKFPEYELLIANPGYSSMELALPQQARFLGALPHQKLIQQLRQAFCVFYPQTLRVETFGLVYAEANAVGTPVLAHDAGAAHEVLSNATQLVNGRKLSAVLDKLSEWREQRPKLQGRDEFRLSRVATRWLELLES